jgi:hypothetical protein
LKGHGFSRVDFSADIAGFSRRGCIEDSQIIPQGLKPIDFLAVLRHG